MFHVTLTQFTNSGVFYLHLWAICGGNMTTASQFLEETEHPALDAKPSG